MQGTLVSVRRHAVAALMALLSCAFLCLAACSASAPTSTYTTLSDLEDKRIGVTTGSIQELRAQERFPNARILHYSTPTDAVGALVTNKVDAFAEAEPIIRHMMEAEPRITILDERLSDEMSAAGIFPKTDKGRALRDEYSAFIREAKASGEYDEVMSVWFGSDESRQVPPDLASLRQVEPRLRMACDSSMYPFVYLKDGKLAGLDVEMAYRFCKSRGYGLETTVMDFGGMLPAIATGKCDFVAGGVIYTEERAESVLFSEPTYEGCSVVAVLGQTGIKTGLASSLAQGFEKTLVREGRWKLFVRGLGTTLLITVLSCVLGTALGFVIYLLHHSGPHIVAKALDLALKLIHGMPTVVLLMVLYYIVFGSIDVGGLVVAVLGFTLVFGVDMYGMLDAGVRAVDPGQAEAACALGYTERKAFFLLILPQAALHFMPTYSGSLVGLLKATSVVGYIAVQDLTKMGDIVRSVTYEAFFPLIVVTVLYFVLEYLLGKVVSLVSARMDPRRRTRERILKGISHDG